MKKSKAWVFFLAALALMSFLVYHFFINDAGNRGIHDQLRLNQADDVVLVELIRYDGQRRVFEKLGPGNWLSNDSVKIDALLIDHLLRALRRVQIQRPVPIMNRQQIIDDLTSYGVTVKAYSDRYWVNLPGNYALFPRKKKIYDAVLGFDHYIFEISVISSGKSAIPYEVNLHSNDRDVNNLLTLDLADWRDPVVVSLLPSEISQLSVTFAAKAGESFELELLPDTFYLRDHKGTLINAASINMNRLARFLNAFSQLSYEKPVTTMPGQLPDEILSVEPFLHQKIKDLNGNTIKLSYYYRKRPDDGTLVSEVRDFDPNRFYLETQQGDFALARYVVFQPTMRPLSYFLENTE